MSITRLLVPQVSECSISQLGGKLLLSLRGRGGERSAGELVDDYVCYVA